MTWRAILSTWILVYLQYLYRAAGDCTFPTELDGVWYSAHKGAMTFNSSFVIGYPIEMSATVKSLDFTCYENSGYRYLLRSTTTTLVFGNLIRAYLCIELYRVSEYKFIYYMGTTISGTNNDNVLGRTDFVTVSFSIACNKATPYDDGAFIVLVKDGAPNSGMGEATNTEGFLAKFGSVSMTSYDGSTTCTGSSMDGCTGRTHLSYSYAACSSGLAFSSGGYFITLHSVISGDYIYLSAWNNDTTVDGTSTYRFSCYVLSVSGSTTYATEFPNYCSDSSQTPTSVPTPGIVYQFTSRTEQCYDIVEGGSSAMYVIIIIVGSLLIICGIICFVLYKVGICKKMMKRRGSTQSDIEDEDRMNINYNRRDTVSRTMFKISNSRPPLDSKRGYRMFPGPIVEANMIQPLPKVEPLYALKKNSPLSAMSRKSSAGSMFDFRWKI